MEGQYKVVLKGLNPGIDAVSAKQSLASLFKVSVEQVERVLAQSSYVVKRGLALETASKYQTAIGVAGGHCVVEQESVAKEQLDFGLESDPKSPQIESAGQASVTASRGQLPPAGATAMSSYCSKCGAQLAPGAAFCGGCGRSVAIPMPTVGEAPMHAPKTPQQSEGQSKEATGTGEVALWNPLALANWSFLLTPVFGAYLVTQNYKAMGREKDAQGAMEWCYISIGVLLSVLVLRSLGDIGGVIILLAYIANLLAWNFRSARKQHREILAEYGKDYPRQPWGRVLVIGLAVSIAWQVIVGATA